MWLSRLLVTAFLVTLAACADMKVQSLGTSLAEQDIRISVVEAGGREGQIYSRALRDRLMSTGAGLETHSLSTSISSSSKSTLSVSGQSSQLKKMTMSANINLVDLQSGEVVYSQGRSAQMRPLAPYLPSSPMTVPTDMAVNVWPGFWLNGSPLASISISSTTAPDEDCATPDPGVHQCRPG